MKLCAVLCIWGTKTQWMIPGCEMDVGLAGGSVKVGVDELLVEGNVGGGRVGCVFLIRERSNLIGADGWIDRGLNGNGSGEGEHEGRWIGEIVGENEGCLG